MTLDYDFYIQPQSGTALGFNTRITAETPYERATAQFRKEQFDSTPTVGDQSLSGWWTRGQLSFHKGAGTRFYEVDGREEVLNRFHESSGIYPWEPGEVTLSPALSEIALTSVRDAVGATISGVPGVLAHSGDNELTFVGETVGAKQYASNYADIESITTSGTWTYVTTEPAIEGPNLSGSHPMGTNVVRNPRFVTGGTADLSGHSSNGGAVPLVTYFSGYATWTVTDGGSANGAICPLNGLTINEEYRVVVDNDVDSDSIDIYLDNDAASAGTYLGTVAVGARGGGTFVATSTAHSILLIGGGNGTERRINGFDVTSDKAALDQTPGYNPVDNPAYVWTGTANQSTSTRTISTNVPYPLWYPPAGEHWVGSWWAKGRLLALDSQGAWYSLSTAGGTATDTDRFWNPGMGTDDWSVAESPGGIYIAHGTDIYLVTLDTNGLLPVVSTPIVAASLPTGESISVAYAYLGRMVICTNLGLRVAVINNDGSLIYGPWVVEGDFSTCRRVTALGDLAYVVGQTYNSDGTYAGAKIFTVNVADNEDFEPSWVEVIPADGAGTALYGATITPDGKVMAWSPAGFYRTSDGLQETGHLTTGYHRLGTLDPKSFRYLRVKTSGTVGTVAVSAVLLDGTEVSIGSLDAGESSDLRLPDAAAVPTEYIALKFTLTGDGTDGPILGGYQLKALPLPRRQRMFRVPLMLFDKESNRNGQQMGTPGSAWERLAALEALEESNAVVTFDDKETGETGSAYIESIEVRRSTPAGRQRDSFGGLIYLTLRQI